MKKIAAILFFIFATVQVAPAVYSLLSPTATSVFMVDEEKGDEVKGNDKKEKKDFPFFLYHANELTHQLTIAFHLAERIFAFPCLEKLTPPPNFC